MRRKREKNKMALESKGKDESARKMFKTLSHIVNLTWNNS